MPTKKEALVQRVQELSKRLTEVAPNLNTASDRLGTSITKLQDRIKPLGLGVSSWVPFRSSHSEDGFYYSIEELGYTKIEGKWGFAISTRSGCEAQPEDEKNTVWAFNEAPREMRVRSVGKIPDLLEKLIKDVEAMAKSVSESASQVDAFSDAFTSESPVSQEKK